MRNFKHIDSLLETTTLPNPSEAAPDLLIELKLGLIASTTSQMNLLNTYMVKIPLQHNILMNNKNYFLINQT